MHTKKDHVHKQDHAVECHTHASTQIQTTTCQQSDPGVACEGGGGGGFAVTAHLYPLRFITHLSAFSSSASSLSELSLWAGFLNCL